MSKIDEILKKSLQGKIATDSKLGVDQEPFPSNTLVDYAAPSSLAEAFSMPPMKDARFLPSTPQDYANRLQVRPLSIPRRFRRWTEAALVFGADLFSEGDELDVTAAGVVESLQDINFAGNFNLSPNFGVISDTFILLHDASNFTNANALSNLKALRVDSSLAEEITLASADLSVTDGGSTYRWSHYGFYPPQLLPLPNSNGEVTAYAAILPEDWPVISWTREFSDLTFGSALTKADVSSVNVVSVTLERVAIETPAASLVVDDYVILQGRVFHVNQVLNVGATDNVYLIPIHPFDIEGLSFGSGQTLQTLYKVSDLIADPTNSPGTNANGVTIPPLYDSPCLDWIRVRRLYPPRATDRNRSLLGAFIDRTPSEKIGFAPALIPATAGGNRELAVNGVTDFSSVTLDPAISEDQEILVDYREGIFHLSHPIAAGSDLNPNSYTDGNGYPRLYAVFAAYNRETVPTTVTQLRRGGSKTGVTSIPTASEENTPLAGKQGWKVTLGDEATGRGGYYYYPPEEVSDASPPIEFGGRNEAIYLLESNLANNDGPLMVFQKRSEVDGLYSAGALAYNGRGASDAADTAQFTFIPDVVDYATRDLESTNIADFRIRTTRQVANVQASLYYSISPGDTLAGTLNGVDFNIALIDDATDGVDSAAPGTGITVTDGQRSIPEVIEDIAAKMPGGLTRGEDYELSYYHDGSNYVFVFEASRSLEIATDDASLFSSGSGTPEDIHLSFGYNKAIEATLRYVRKDAELFFDGAGVRVQDTRLGVPAPSSWVYEGFGVSETSVEGGQAFLSLNPGTLITPDGPVRFSEETRVSLAAGQRIGVYYDFSSGNILTLNQGGNSDSPFDGLDVEDIPLWVVKTSGTPTVDYTVDVRDFYANADSTTNLTVGTGGRLTSLAGAVELAKKVNKSLGVRPVIELLEDTTLVLDEVNTDNYPNIQASPYDGAPLALPRDLLILGNNRTVTVSGVPNETGGLGDPLFRANQDFNPGVAGESNVEFRNVVFEVSVSQGDPVSLMAGNFPNNGRATFVDVILNGNGVGEVLNLYSATNASDSLQADTVIRNCQVDGNVRMREVGRLIIEDLEHLGVAVPAGTLQINLADGAYVRIDGIQSASTTTAGYAMALNVQDDANVHVSNVEVRSLTVAPNATNVTGAYVSVHNAQVGINFDLGSATNTLSGVVLVDGVSLNTTSTTTAVSIDQVSYVEMKNGQITSAADVTMDVTDSDLVLTNVSVNNTSVNTGATTKIGLRLQGDNGTLINGVNAMDSDIIVDSCVFEVSEGSGIYVVKANESGKRTVIRNSRFENTDNNTSWRAVCFNADGGTATADNVDGVYISHNVFDAYAVSATDNYAVGTPGLPTGNLGDITIVFNHARGLAAGATAFANVGSSVVSNNAFTL